MRRFERRVAEIKRRRKDRVKAFVFAKSVAQDDDDELVAELKEDLLVAEIALHEAQIDDLDIEVVLTFAEKALTSAASIWVEADLKQRQRFHGLLFPEGLEYSQEEGFRTPTTLSLFSNLRHAEEVSAERTDGEGFRTPQSAFVFSGLRESAGGSREMVARTGFEPVLPA